MKKNYLFTLLLTLCFITVSFGQTTLSAGDLVVIELKADTEDAFRFVPLVDLEAGTVLKFTDNRWDGTALTDNEGTIIYTAPTGGVTAGTNISFDNGNVPADFDVTNNIALSTSGDQILVYQGDKASPTFIFAVQSNSTLWQDPSSGTKQSNLPQGLTDGVNAVAAGAGTGNETEFDNVYYTGITSGTKDALLAAVANAGNWGGNNSSSTPITTNFTISAPTTDPGLTITSPSNNQVFPADVGNIPVNFNISNFTLSGDNGSEMTDNTGDGYILGSLSKNGVSDGTVNIFSTTGPEIENAEPGVTYIITAELVDNNGASLSPKVESTVTFSVDFPCDIELGNITTNCQTTSSNGGNTYDISIPFSGGNTSTYVLGTNSGIIGGDDPSLNETGTITITDIAEGTSVAFTLKGDVSNSVCDLSRNITSPICVGLPLLESFDYTADTDLVSHNLWIDIPTSSATKNNIQVKLNDDGFGNSILGSYYAPTDLPPFSGNMISMSGSGSDAYLGFKEVTSGTVYASFTFHVTNMTGFTKTAGGYFAILGDSSFRGRLWIKDPTAGAANEGLTFNLGLSTTGSTTYHTGFTANLAEPVFVVMSYNLDNDEVKLWIVPSETTFGTNTPPAADITLTGNGDAINRFTLRQDSTSETPFMDIDELRIGTTWAHVTSNPVASVRENVIEGFETYPNPVSDKLTISSFSAEKKQLSIYNVLGKRVFSTNVYGLKSDVDVSAISSGLYILKVTEGAKTVTSKLVIK